MAFIRHGGLRRELLPGTLHLIPANALLSYGCDSKFTVHWTHFTAKASSGFEIVPHLGCRLELAQPGEDAIELFSALLKPVGTGSLAAELKRQASLLLLLSKFNDEVGFPDVELRINALARFNAVFSMLDARVGNPPSVEEMASAMQMAPASFSRLFKSFFGLSPWRFALERRLGLAKKLLDEGLKLDEIAFRLGFSDAFHLSKTFKRMNGLSPSEYRVQGHRQMP